MKKLLELAKWVFAFGQQTNKNQKDIEALQTEVRQLTAGMQQIVWELRRQRDEMQNRKDADVREREILLLRLENELLRFERRLPDSLKEDKNE